MIKILLFMLICSVLRILEIQCQSLPYSGIRCSLSMSSYKQDLAHIYRTILRNSKFFDYPDKEVILSYNKEGFKIRLSEIEQVNFTCDEDFISRKLSHKIDSSSVIFNYSGSLAQATYNFKWELMQGNFHVSEGKGITNYSTLNTSIFLSSEMNLHTTSHTYWNLTDYKIYGATIIGFDETITNEISKIIYKGLNDAEVTNQNFIEKYSIIKYNRIKSLIESDLTTIILANTLNSVDALSINGVDMIVFRFNSSVMLNYSSQPYYVKSIVMNSPNLSNGIEICFNNEITVAALNSLFDYHNFLFDIDPKSLGYSGFVSDLFNFAPQLSESIPPDRTYSIKCMKIVNRSIEYNNSESSSMKIPIRCNVIMDDVQNIPIFNFEFLSVTEFSHRTKVDLYYSLITNSIIYQISFVPIEVKTAEFLFFANKMINILKDKIFDLPNLYGDFMLKREFIQYSANKNDICLYYI